MLISKPEGLEYRVWDVHSAHDHSRLPEPQLHISRAWNKEGGMNNSSDRRDSAVLIGGAAGPWPMAYELIVSDT